MQTSPVAGATRHHFYVGTITTISAATLVIYSKTHHASYRFVIDNGTKFMKSGKAISRLLFKTGSYVTVSYSAGPHGTMIAWHVSLRKCPRSGC
jgi:hypothetical protein